MVLYFCIKIIIFKKRNQSQYFEWSLMHLTVSVSGGCILTIRNPAIFLVPIFSSLVRFLLVLVSSFLASS